jgi:hypothetical protein
VAPLARPCALKAPAHCLLEYPMENTLNYQFNYGAQPAPPVPLRIDPSAPLFASEDGMVASLSSHECIFVAKRTGEPHVMTFQVLQALDQCREFRTLDEHIARIQSTISGLTGKRDEIKRVLDSLAQRELLVSDQQFFERVRSAPATPPKMRAVFIRACDRPAQIEQLLRSLTDYERRFRAGRHYIVLDDSVLPAHVDEQRDLLREFARTTGCKASYIGQAERTRLVEKLARARPQSKDVIARLLTRAAFRRRPRHQSGAAARCRRALRPARRRSAPAIETAGLCAAGPRCQPRSHPGRPLLSEHGRGVARRQ